MSRSLLAAIVLVVATSPLCAETLVTGKNVRIVNSFIIAKSDLPLAEAPRNTGNKHVGVINDQAAFDALWKAWRTGDPPKQDFAKHLVLVMTHAEHGRVEFLVNLDGAGSLDVQAKVTGRRIKGNTYVIAIGPREGLKTIGGTPAPK